MGSSLSPGTSFDNDSHYPLDTSPCIGRMEDAANEEGWTPSPIELALTETPPTLPQPWEQDLDLSFPLQKMSGLNPFSPVPEEVDHGDPQYWTWSQGISKYLVPSLMYAPSQDLFSQHFDLDSDPLTLPSEEPPSPGGTNRRQICNQCKQVFPTGKELEAHAKDTKHRSYICSANGCNKRYWRRDVLQRHTAVHKEVWQWPCKLCFKSGDPKGFTRKDRLVLHVRNQHGQKEAELFLEAVPSKKKKSSSSVCGDIDNQTSSTGAAERSSELTQSMQDIQNWVRNKLGANEPNGKKLEPRLSHSCPNTFITDLATALKQDGTV